MTLGAEWGAPSAPHQGTSPGCSVRGEGRGVGKGSEEKGFSTESRQPFVQAAWTVREPAVPPGWSREHGHRPALWPPTLPGALGGVCPSQYSSSHGRGQRCACLCPEVCSGAGHSALAWGPSGPRPGPLHGKAAVKTHWRAPSPLRREHGACAQGGPPTNSRWGARPPGEVFLSTLDEAAANTAQLRRGAVPRGRGWCRLSGGQPRASPLRGPATCKPSLCLRVPSGPGDNHRGVNWRWSRLGLHVSVTSVCFHGTGFEPSPQPDPARRGQGAQALLDPVLHCDSWSPSPQQPSSSEGFKIFTPPPYVHMHSCVSGSLCFVRRGEGSGGAPLPCAEVTHTVWGRDPGGQQDHTALGIPEPRPQVQAGLAEAEAGEAETAALYHQLLTRPPPPAHAGARDRAHDTGSESETRPDSHLRVPCRARPARPLPALSLSPARPLPSLCFHNDSPLHF